MDLSLRVKYIVLFILSAAMIEILGDEQIPISVTSGIYWRQQEQAVMYEATVPLVYKSQWPSVDMAYLSLPKEIGFCNTTLNDPQCLLMSWILQTDKIIGRQLRWLNSSFDSASYEADEGPINVRFKRTLKFVGDFAHWCCGVASDRQLKPLFTNQKLMHTFEQSLKEQQDEAFSEIDNLDLNMKNYSRQVEATFARVIDVNVNITKIIDRFQRKEIIAEQTNERNSFRWLQLSAHHVVRQLQTIRLVARLEIQSQCRERKIPTSVVTTEKLKNDLLLLSRSIQEDGYDLAIPAEEVTKYLKLEIADCVISGDEILVTLRIPIKRREAEWKLFEPIAVPFAWDNNTCTIQHGVSYLAVDGERIMSIRGDDSADCQPHSQRLCYVPRHASDKVSGSPCLRKMFLGDTIKELSNVCTFSCITEQAAVVTKISDFTYVLTHVKLPVMLSCRYSENKTHAGRDKRNLGALETEVPCDCNLISENNVLISESYPCGRNPSVSQVVHIVPAPWSKLKSLKISPLHTQSANTFNTFEEFLDENWPSQLPHWHTSLTQRTKPPSHNLYLPTEERNWYSSILAVLQGLCMVLVSVIVVRNPYLIGVGFNNVVMVRAEGSVMPGQNNEKYMIEFLSTVIIVCCFVFGIRALIKAIKRCKSRKEPEALELTAQRRVQEDAGLPRDMVLTEVDGRELRITLEWWTAPAMEKGKVTG